MTAEEKRKGGGAKTGRSENVTVRLDRRLRYLAEIAGRVQRRTLSSYIEWAVEESLRHVVITEDKEGRTYSIAEVDSQQPLWDDEEADRFLILASRFPELLTFDEMRLWQMFNAVAAIIQPTKDYYGPKKGFRLDLKDVEMFRMNYDLFRTAARTNQPAEVVAKEVALPDEYQQSIQLLAAKLRTLNPAERKEGMKRLLVEFLTQGMEGGKEKEALKTFIMDSDTSQQDKPSTSKPRKAKQKD